MYKWNLFCFRGKNTISDNSRQITTSNYERGTSLWEKTTPRLDHITGSCSRGVELGSDIAEADVPRLQRKLAKSAKENQSVTQLPAQNWKNLESQQICLVRLTDKSMSCLLWLFLPWSISSWLLSWLMQKHELSS